MSSQDLQFARLMRSFQKEPDNPQAAVRLANHVSRNNGVMPDVESAIEKAAQKKFKAMERPSCPPCPPQKSCPPQKQCAPCPKPPPCPAPKPCPIPEPCPVCPTALQGVTSAFFNNKMIAIPAFIGTVALFFYVLGRNDENMG